MIWILQKDPALCFDWTVYLAERFRPNLECVMIALGLHWTVWTNWNLCPDGMCDLSMAWCAPWTVLGHHNWHVRPGYNISSGLDFAERPCPIVWPGPWTVSRCVGCLPTLTPTLLSGTII